jgi:hypothetical protein
MDVEERSLNRESGWSLSSTSGTSSGRAIVWRKLPEFGWSLRAGQVFDRSRSSLM